MNDVGEGKFNYTPTSNGKLMVVVSSKMNGYKDGSGICTVNVGEKRSALTPFEKNESSSMYSHLKKTDYAYQSLKANYGKNILKYLVKDGKLNDKRLVDTIDTKKKTVLVFGYPACGGCTEMMKAMAPLPHEDYNFIEVVTSVDEDVASTVKMTEDLLENLKITNLKSHIYYDAVDTIWASRMDLLTTPNTLFLDENGRLINIAGQLDAASLKEMYKKTFNEDINIGEDVEPINETFKITVAPSKTTFSLNEAIYISGNVKSPQGKYLANKNFTVKITGEEEIVEKVNTDSKGNLNIAFEEGRLKEGNYVATVSYDGTDYKVTTGTTKFQVANTNPTPNETKLTFNQRYQRGEFNHNDQALNSNLQRAYGTNVKEYTLTGLDGKQRTVGSIIDGKRPTVIALGYPTCSACQNSWGSLIKIDKTKFNMIEAMTTTSISEVNRVLDSYGYGAMKPYFYVGAGSLFNVLRASGVPVLMFLDKDGNVTNASFFSGNTEVHRIISTITNTLSVK